MSNQQFDEVEKLLQASRHRRNECPTCDTKAVEVADGITEWEPSTYRYHGETLPCNCEEQEALYRHYLLARIPEEYMRLSEDDYEGDVDAFESIVDYLDNWKNYLKHGLGMGFYSKRQGTGKTMLATYIARELIKKGVSVYYTYFLDMIQTYRMPYEAYAEEENRLRDCTVLILDEIAKPISNSQRDLFGEKFESLIRHRSNYGKVTILTTNLTPEELDHEYPRTYSLLAAKEKSIKVEGGDVRREGGILTVNEELAANGEVRPIR